MSRKKQDNRLPHNVEAEDAVIGSLLIDPYAISKALTILLPKDFFIVRNEWVYEAIVALDENEVAPDLVTVCDELERHNRLDEIGGAAHLTSLMNVTPSSLHLEHYASIVYRMAVQRRYISAAEQIAKMAYQTDIDLDILSDQSDRLILNARPTVREGDYIAIGKLAEKELDRQETLTGEEMTGLSTGLSDLDKLLGGLQKSDVIIMAGRPGMGKSSLALSIVLYIAKELKKRIAIHSLEMSDEQLAQRSISAESGISTQDIRLGNLEGKWQQFFEGAKVIDELGDLILIDDTPSISAQELRAKAKRNHILYGLDLLIVDYLQLMRGGSRFENRQQEISYISRSIKALARELNIPIIALSQLSRQVEGRQDKRPILSDLRESGSLEQDADIVLFIYRDEVYNPDTEFPNVAEIIAGKHRSGPTGRFSVYFRKDLAQFVDLEIRKQSLDEWEDEEISY